MRGNPGLGGCICAAVGAGGPGQDRSHPGRTTGGSGERHTGPAFHDRPQSHPRSRLAHLLDQPGRRRQAGAAEMGRSGRAGVRRTEVSRARICALHDHDELRLQRADASAGGRAPDPAGVRRYRGAQRPGLLAGMRRPGLYPRTREPDARDSGVRFGRNGPRGRRMADRGLCRGARADTAGRGSGLPSSPSARAKWSSTWPRLFRWKTRPAFTCSRKPKA